MSADYLSSPDVRSYRQLANYLPHLKMMFLIDILRGAAEGSGIV